jgi:hypothetical protein
MSSITVKNNLIKQLLPMRFQDFSAVGDSFILHSQGRVACVDIHDSVPCSAKQVAWDEPLCKLNAVGLLSAAPSQSDRASELDCGFSSACGRFLNCSAEFNSWYTRLDNTSFCIAVALRLDLLVSSQYMCVCGTADDSYGAHALVYRKTHGRVM